MNKSEAEQRKQSIIEELQRLKHLQYAHAHLDDGLFVRSVVAQMNEAMHGEANSNHYKIESLGMKLRLTEK